MLRTLIALLLLSLPAAVSAQQVERSASLVVFFSELAAAAQAGDRDAYTNSFAPDAAIFLPHRRPLLGRKAIGDWFDNFRSSVELHLKTYEQLQIDIVGDVAMVRSHATGYYLIVDSEKKLPLDQKYLDVLRYEGGKWTMMYHVADSNNFSAGLWEIDWESR